MEAIGGALGFLVFVLWMSGVFAALAHRIAGTKPGEWDREE